MNSNIKTAVFWVVIIMVVVLLWTVVRQSFLPGFAADVPYSKWWVVSRPPGLTVPLSVAVVEPTAEASFAAMRERSRFGIAIAAMIRMIATTINNSINENPLCLRVIFSPMAWFTAVFAAF